MGLEEMMGMNAGGKILPIEEKDLELGFQPIKGLMPGDRVRNKGGIYNCYKFPQPDEIVTVYSVFPHEGHPKENGQHCFGDRDDFSVLVTAKGGPGDSAVMELPLDSRRFVLVE